MECLVCKHRFIRVKNYGRHLDKEHPEVNVDDVISQTPSKAAKPLSNTCEICNRNFASIYKLNIHTRTHLNTLSFSCETCNRAFPTRTRLRLHVEGVHSKGEFRCHSCKEVFNSQLTLNRHMNSHKVEAKESHECPQCGRRHKTAYALRCHLVSHSADRCHLCEKCDSSFSRASALKQHSKLHSINKAFQCGECGDRFVSNGLLNKHLVSHSDIRPHVCKVCQKAFSRKGDLTVHSRTHTNTRTHVCAMCRKAFMKRSHLKDHEKLHGGVEPLACEVCGERFNLQSEFNRHKRTCKVSLSAKDFGSSADLIPLAEPDILSPLSFFSDRLTLSPSLFSNQNLELMTSSQQTLMSHTADEAVTQALKAVVHTPDFYDVTPTFSQHYPFNTYQHPDFVTNQFDEFIFPSSMHIQGAGFDVSVRDVSSNDVTTPLIDLYLPSDSNSLF